jgi:outer membrane protein OmpA-like peptidoglycan-associated protein
MGQPSSSAASDYVQGSLAFGEPESEGRAEHRVEDEFRVYVNMRGQGDIGERIGNPQLIASIYFETNKYKVDAEGLAILRDIAHYSRRNWRLTLRGYADFTGEAEHNQRLSMYRAEDVESWLKLYRDEYDESHIMQENIIPVGMGAREKNIAYSLDRVVEIYLELVESEPIDENIIEQQISDLQNVLSEHDVQEARAKCILEKCRDRLKTYVLGQQPEMNELFFTVVGAYNYCRDELWRKPGYVDSTRRKHGTSILEELTVRVILPEVDLQEKVQLLVMLDTRIADGITQLDTQMSGVGSVRYSEEAAIRLARFILDRNEDPNDFYSCYRMDDIGRSILGSRASTDPSDLGG